MDTPSTSPYDSRWKSMLEDVESEWEAIAHGDGEIWLYLYHLDRLLLGCMENDDVVLAGLDALSQRYLYFTYPEGEGRPKRNLSTCSKDDIEAAWIDPKAINNLLWEKAIEFSETIRNSLMDRLSNDGILHS